MRVGIDFLFAQNGTTQGYDSCLRNLLLGLDELCINENVIVFCNSSYFLENRSKFSNLELVDCRVNWENRFQRAIFESVSIPSLIKKYNIDGIYFPTHFRPIMDLGNIWSIFNLHDLQYRYLPNNFGRFQRLVRDYYYQLSLNKCNRTICLTKYVQKTVLEQFPYFDPERLIIIPDPITFTDIGDEADDNIDLGSLPYIFSIGKHFPHKNYETLIRAFAIVLHRNQFHGLLIIGGSFTSHTKYLLELTKELNISNQVRFVGYVNDETRDKLYRSSKLFVFPSLYEGFGMPVIEAMGRQLPVVCSNTTALFEVTLGLANYYDPATSEESLAQVIIDTLSNPPAKAQLKMISNRVRELYNIEIVSQQHLSLWESLDSQ